MEDFDFKTDDGGNRENPPAGFPERRMQFSEVNDTFRAVMGAIARKYADEHTLTATGSNGALAVTTTRAFDAYFDGLTLGFYVPSAFNQVGPCTLNVTSNGTALGTVPVVHPDNGDLTEGQLVNESFYRVIYRRGLFQLITNQESTTFPTVSYIGAASQTLTSEDIGGAFEIAAVPASGGFTIILPQAVANGWPVGGYTTYFELDGNAVIVDPPPGVRVFVGFSGSFPGSPVTVLPEIAGGAARKFYLLRIASDAFRIVTV